MSKINKEILDITYCRNSTFIPMGRLVYKDRKIYFEYAPSFLELGLQLSPFKLPLKPGVLVCNDYVFDGLFGIFNDSLPDGWGRLLIDRKLIKMKQNPHALTPLDRLRFVGSRGMGALHYHPPIEETQEGILIEDLDRIADECLQVFEYAEDQFIEDLLALNGSSAGARPKIMVRLLPDDKGFVQTESDPQLFHNDWLIKFRSSLDPQDIGSIEYAYHLMAQKAGLDVPEAKLFKSKTCEGYFGVKRFDRSDHQFFHMHTISGLLHADHRIPCLDYEVIMKATQWLTRDIRECEKQFRNAVFNVFGHNRDDHAKNFSFLLDEKGIWHVSPAYDLTFSSGPSAEHYTTVMGEGKNPKTSHLLKLASVVNIQEKKAKQIIAEVKEAISEWPKCAQIAHVSPRSIKMIEKNLTMLNSS